MALIGNDSIFYYLRLEAVMYDVLMFVVTDSAVPVPEDHVVLITSPLGCHLPEL